ncbi:MAG: saccharopine dehydrogenase NADP-binding domain-containing protein [Bythopirellula sp.]|nr:saccharopine dehydrogenase NADP-binding domain-containing protein [Bythopirellula sp.]
MFLPWMIYGANGYTGEVIAREAIERGLRPILAGRSREKIEPLAQELGLEWRAFALDRLDQVARGLEGVKLVLHCAGPFSVTSAPMIEGCLGVGAHYLDITGEIGVIEHTHAKPQAHRAKDVGVVLCSGVGFDVVPTDCVALKLKELLPEATHLSLGFETDSAASPGTLKTALESLEGGTLRRREGQIVKTPNAETQREIDFGRGKTPAMAISWGDVSSAYYTTRIANIDTWIPVPGKRTGVTKILNLARPLLATAFMQSALKKLVTRFVNGPSAAQRKKSRTWVWGEATNAAGEKMTVRIEVGNVYDVTVDAALKVVTHLSDGDYAGGSYTPAMLLGSRAVEELVGVGKFEIDYNVAMSEANIDNSGRNVLGDVGLWLTATGWILAFVFSLPSLNFLLPIPAAICPLGLIFGLFGLWRKPRRSAQWAIALGVAGQFCFVGTVWTHLIMAIR